MSQIISEQERMEYGADLLRMMETEGWKRFVDILEKHKRDIALVALKDEKNSKEYYLGWVNALEALHADVSELVREYVLREGVEEAEADSRVSREILGGMGGGSLA